MDRERPRTYSRASALAMNVNDRADTLPRGQAQTIEFRGAFLRRCRQLNAFDRADFLESLTTENQACCGDAPLSAASGARLLHVTIIPQVGLDENNLISGQIVPQVHLRRADDPLAQELRPPAIRRRRIDS